MKIPGSRRPMRKLHRWIAVGAVVFLSVVAATGVLLQFEKLSGADADDPDNAPYSAAYTTATPLSVYASILQRALAVARQRAPGVPIVSVTMMMGEQPKVFVRLPGDPGRQIAIDGRRGTVLADDLFQPESLLQRIHDGSILGDPGVAMGLVWGLALVVLSITGFWIYADMYRRRARTTTHRRLF